VFSLAAPLSSRPPRRPVLVALLVALLVTALGTILGAMPAQAVDTGTFGIRPAHESAFFHLNAYPGETLHNSAIVSNHTGRPVTLLDYPVDAHDSATGTFAMASETDPRSTVGAWVHLAAGSIAVPAGADRPLAFHLTVPAQAAPGDYAGALIIQAPPTIGRTAVHNGTAVRLDVVQRQGLRIYLHVQGTATRALAAGGLSWTNDGDGADFTIPIRNTGNTTLHPTAELTLTSRMGANTRLRFTRVESILPGDQLTLHAHLTRRVTLQIGTATATIHSEAGNRTLTADYTDLPWVPLAAGTAVLLGAVLAAVLAVAGRIRTLRSRRTRSAARPGSGHRPAGARHRAQPAR
jgi:hypothetical protein